jgi:flagellar biosynthesis/type III secretory pathway protein FliH
MALIKHANASMLAREAVVLDLGDLQRQGMQIVQQAQAQAAKIVADAKAERERILAGAMEKGHAEGKVKGLEEGRKQGFADALDTAIDQHSDALSKLEANWATELSELGARRDVLFQRAADDVIRLAVLIAERVVKRAIAADPTIVVEQLKSVMGLISRPTELVVYIHPEDRPIVHQAVPGLLAVFAAIKHVELVSDPKLERGSCVARTRMEADTGSGGGEIDASIQSQITRIVALILPGHDVAEAGDAPAAPGAMDSGAQSSPGVTSW